MRWPKCCSACDVRAARASRLARPRCAPCSIRWPCRRRFSRCQHGLPERRSHQVRHADVGRGGLQAVVGDQVEYRPSAAYQVRGADRGAAADARAAARALARRVRTDHRRGPCVVGIPICCRRCRRCSPRRGAGVGAEHGELGDTVTVTGIRSPVAVTSRASPTGCSPRRSTCRSRRTRAAPLSIWCCPTTSRRKARSCPACGKCAAAHADRRPQVREDNAVALLLRPRP